MLRGLLSPPQTFEDGFDLPKLPKTEFEKRYERAKRATAEAEVRAIFQGYPIEVTDGNWDEMHQGSRLKRHAVRMFWIYEKKGGGEGSHSAELYFDDSGRLIDSMLSYWFD